MNFDLWSVVGALATGLLVALAAGHALLNKRDVRAAIGWVGLIVLSPVVGAVLYGLLGINRLHRRATSLGPLRSRNPLPSPGPARSTEDLCQRLAEEDQHLESLARIGERVSHLPLIDGNRVHALRNGEEAYPAMVRAIDTAQVSVTLLCYIFDVDEVGRRFASALAAAHRRGVAVKVLVDAAGVRYSWPASIVRELRRDGVEVARFLPTVWPWNLPYANLRNHRKVMVVDGRLGYTGGMNLRAGHLVASATRGRTQDVHFEVEGPVVAELQQVFAHDWCFVTGEALNGERYFPQLEPCGTVLARAIADGPDESFDALRWILLGALASAHRSVRIVTPYFLPDAGLILALGVAALRGVAVEIYLPQRGNLLLVQWAATAQLWQVLERGCRVFLTPPPFDHAKLLVVDAAWSFVGSANWDPRSLRLNFELQLECWGRECASEIEKLIDQRRSSAHEITLAEVDGRPLPVRLRDSAARLLAPYL